MRYAVVLMGFVAAAVGPCDTGEPEPAPGAPAILAAGNLNNLYVATAAQAGAVSGFRYWQRDAQGMWHEGRFARGVPAAVAAWREDLLVFFPSGRWGRFGLERPVIEPSPVPAWTPVAACEDGLGADAFGYTSAGDPFHARYEDGAWTAAQVEAGVEREKMADARAVRFRGRLFLFWREEVPTLTGPAPDVRLRFLCLGEDGWHGPVTSRLRVGSALDVAADDETMAGLFLRAAGDDSPGQWVLATYAAADEDWHEIGPVVGPMPPGPVTLARSGRHFFLVALADGAPVLAPLDVADARVGEFMPVGTQPRKAEAETTEVMSLLLFAFTVLMGLLILASWRRTGMGAPAAPAPDGQASVEAPLLKRAVAIAMDHVLFLPITLVLAHLYLPPGVQEQLGRWQFDLLDERAVERVALVGFMTRGLIILYCCVAEGAFGRTLGKRLMGLEVRTESALRISWRASVIRNVLRVVDEFPAFYLLGLLLILLGPKRQRLGDRLAHTIVVISNSSEPAGG